MSNNKLKIIDLCGRLPYGVVCSVYGDTTNGVKLCGIKANNCYFEDLNYKEEDGYVSIEDVKPYLRPMDSMTADEGAEYSELQSRLLECMDADIDYQPYSEVISQHIDWLNAHHFDYRWLIGKGLALEAPKGMYI